MDLFGIPREREREWSGVELHYYPSLDFLFLCVRLYGFLLLVCWLCRCFSLRGSAACVALFSPVVVVMVLNEKKNGSMIN